MLVGPAALMLSSITAIGTINPMVRAGPAGADVAAYPA